MVTDDILSDSPSDGSLLLSYRRGDQDAATRLFYRYASRIKGLANSQLTQPILRRVDPSDIVQSVFRRFFASVDRGNYDVPRGADLWSLLMVITLNRVRSEESSQRADMRDIGRTVSFDEHQVASRSDVLTADERQFSDLFLKEAIRELSEQQQAVVELRIQNYDVAEIAKRIGRSKRTIERLLHDAKSRLVQLMELSDPPSGM